MNVVGDCGPSVPPRIAMSHGELLALPVAVSVYTAGRAFGMGRDKTRQLARDEKLPFAAVRLGQSLMVTRAALFEALGLDPEGAPGRGLPAGRVMS